jgi:hypothetical protein
LAVLPSATSYALTLAAGTAVSLFALLAAGCGGSSNPGVASIGDTDTSPSTTTQSWAAAYHCYATHGYPKYRPIGSPAVPGAPPISGWWKMANGNYGITPDFQKLYGTAKFRAIDRVCEPLIPVKKPTPAQIAADVAQALKVARCMRAHGMPNLPDPDSSGLIHLQSSSEDSSPRFIRAESACQNLMTSRIPFLVPYP